MVAVTRDDANTSVSCEVVESDEPKMPKNVPLLPCAQVLVTFELAVALSKLMAGMEPPLATWVMSACTLWVKFGTLLTKLLVLSAIVCAEKIGSSSAAAKAERPGPATVGAFTIAHM